MLKFHSTLLASMCLLTACSSTTQPTHASDFLFNDALRANTSGDTASLYLYQQQMQGSSLAYYPEYFILNQNLFSQPVHAIQNFADRYPKTALTEKLVADYIEEKARIGDTASVLSLVPIVSNADRSERCAINQVKANAGQKLNKEEYEHEFLVMDDKTQPELCRNLGRNLIHWQGLTEQQRQQRLFVAARAGNTGALIHASNAMNLGLDLSLLNQIQSNPMAYILTAEKQSLAQQIYAIFAMGRIAEQNLFQAIQLVPTVAQGASPELQKYLARTVGFIGGNSVLKNGFNLQTFQLLSQSEGYPFSPEEAEIYARQAIRFAQWQGLASAIGQMSERQKQEDRWQYWLARAMEQSNPRASIHQSIYQKLAQSDDYHGLLAKMRLNQDYKDEPKDQLPSSSDMARATQDEHFVRAFRLKELGAPDAYANREWNWAVRQAAAKQDDGLLLAAAQRADAMGWRDRSIFAADRTTSKHNYTLRYPMPYQDVVVRHSQSAGIHPAWAYGIARQESRFNVNARSSVGAVGFVQVMPDTARLIARKLGESYEPARLREVDTNIRYGTFYLGDIQNNLGGHPMVATAGYNAGPNRAKRWMPSDQPMDADRYAESIPILETRDYVKHVLTNAVHYGTHFDGQSNIQRFMYPIPVNYSY